MGQDVARINDELRKYSQRLAIAVNEYVTACQDAANKRTDYDVLWAKELLKVKGKTVGERNAQVTIICESAMREARIAEGMQSALKERIRALESVLNATQTRASFLKEEMRLAGKDY
jgi:hypothetical protein